MDAEIVLGGRFRKVRTAKNVQRTQKALAVEASLQEILPENRDDPQQANFEFEGHFHPHPHNWLHKNPVNKARLARSRDKAWEIGPTIGNVPGSSPWRPPQGLLGIAGCPCQACATIDTASVLSQLCEKFIIQLIALPKKSS